MPLNEHAYCLAITLKMTWVEQQICIKLCIKLEHSSAETIQVIQKVAAMSNWWLTASSWQRAHLCITSCAVFWWNIKSPRWLSPTIAQIWLRVTSGFSQNKSHLRKGRDFRLSVRFRKIQWGSWWWLELCEVPGCLPRRVLRYHFPVHSVLVFCIFNKCFYFSYNMAGYLLDRPCTCCQSLLYVAKLLLWRFYEVWTK